jgi:AraC family transcriptional regulator
VPYEANLRRAMAFIETHLHTELRLDQVAREAGMSKFHFCRHFKNVADLTFREFLARRRIARGVELLRDRKRSVSDVYLDVGFKNLSHFSRVFLKVTGQSPSRFRRTTHEFH